MSIKNLIMLLLAIFAGYFYFTYLGGGSALKTVGKKTIEVGERVELYEQALKDAAQELLIKKVRDEKEATKERDIKKH